VKRFPRSKIVTLLVIMAALLCLSCGSKQAQHYMLSSTPGLSPVSSGEKAITVGVGPVNLPDYLMRPEIVTRTSGSEVTLAEFNRWAEPLDETMVRVLVGDLSGLLPGANVFGYPWSSTTLIDYRVTIKVMSFEQPPDVKVHLVEAWRVQDGEGETVRTGETRLTAGVDGEGYGPIVSAMNTVLAQLSEEIAGALSG